MQPFWLDKYEHESIKDGQNFHCQRLTRSGHSTELLPYGFVAVIGGFNDVVMNDISFVDLEKLLALPQCCSLDLEQLVIEGVEYKPAASAATCFVASQNAIFIFGGSGTPWGVSTWTEFYKLNLSDRKLEVVVCQSSPQPVYGATLCYYEECLYLFGGTNGSLFSNEVWRFSLTENNWVKLKCKGNVPKGRYKHSCNLVGSEMYVVGGTDINDFDIGSKLEVYKLNLSTYTWSEVITTATPDTRYAHSSVYDSSSNTIIIAGGRVDVRKNGTIYRLSLDNLRWEKIGNLTSPRDFHTSVLYRGYLFTVGGCSTTGRLDSIELLKLPY